MGTGIINVINTFNPQQIIIGNSLALAEDWIKEPLKAKVNQHLQPYFKDQLSVDFSKLSGHATPLGVVASVIESFLKISFKPSQTKELVKE